MKSWTLSCLVLTIAAAVFGVWEMSFVPVEHLEAYGAGISAIAGSLALLWMVAGYYQYARELRMQRDELILQRKELALQREALQQQVDELKNMNQTSALEHVKGIISRMEEDVGKDAIPTLMSKVFPQPCWRDVFNEVSPQLVEAKAQDGLLIRKAPHAFVNALVGAARYYATVTGRTMSVTGSPYEFVVMHKAWMSELPYFSDHLASLETVSQMLWMTERAERALMSAWLAASSFTVGKGFVKTEKVLEDIRKLAAEMDGEGSLPPVCRRFLDEYGVVYSQESKG